MNIHPSPAAWDGIETSAHETVLGVAANRRDTRHLHKDGRSRKARTIRAGNTATPKTAQDRLDLLGVKGATYMPPCHLRAKARNQRSQNNV